MRVLVVGVALVLGASAATHDWGCAPRMRQQPYMRPYERPETGNPPQPPADSIPAPAPGEAPKAEPTAAPPRTAENLVLGKVYYDAYCRHCHGDDGRQMMVVGGRKEHAPVGASYHPTPTDLTGQTVRAMSDQELYRGMIAGTGHEPTLGYIVPPERRWLIVLHVRALEAAPP